MPTMFETCDTGELKQKLMDLSREGQRLVQENQSLQGRLAYLRARAEQQAAKVDQETNDVTKASRKHMVKDLLKEAEEVRQQIKTNGLQCQELAKRSELVGQQMPECKSLLLWYADL